MTTDISELPQIRAAAYLRVSTKDQETAMQRHQIKNFCHTHKYQIVEWYEDKASGREIDGRAQLGNLLLDAVRGNFEAVVVWKLDRFTRSLKDFLWLIDELKKSGVKLHSVADGGVDFTGDDPLQTLLRSILAGFAQMESAIISQRVKASYDLRRQAGERIGPEPKRPCNDIQSLLRKGESYRDIMEKLGVSMGAVCRSARKLRESKTT
jgi:DNA invertase Pin-like site-specific DNA recombinase